MIMAKENCTTVTEFILLGLSDVPELRVLLFLVFLLIYGVTVLANLGMVALIQASSQLHTPMYFFLSHLSLVDFCYSSIIVPKMLANIFTKDKAISFHGCMAQLYLFCTYAITEVFLLALMAYDRFVAICNPLLYMVIMSQKLCAGLVAEGRRKAFSTCASHLTAIFVFHGTILFIYCQPSYGTSLDIDKVTTVFYIVVIPMLNPLIYNLRNKDVKEALRNVLYSKILSKTI
ncbi:Hypothetical predicted protein [Marmota monax]|uniref:G-protein coupled receptors family 1 profile domain-containing protein n=1 Tax=Marmota monax TaxID=9995 RepID=A0A5E4D1P0_MARMO|nr:Hypothetical predicted protein [Marmota monax]